MGGVTAGSAVASTLRPGTRAAVLVEGTSDQVALHTLAARRGRDLDAEGVSIVPMGGATNIARYLEALGPHGSNIRLAGLCDAGEEPFFRRGLERAGFGSGLTRADMEDRGFYVCTRDLEDELIRTLGVGTLERIIEAEGELASLRLLRKQPAQQGRSTVDQLHRFIGTRAGRKARYARLLTEALDLGNVPRPLEAVLTHV
jgi:hypothetical protein